MASSIHGFTSGKTPNYLAKELNTGAESSAEMKKRMDELDMKILRQDPDDSAIKELLSLVENETINDSSKQSGQYWYNDLLVRLYYNAESDYPGAKKAILTEIESKNVDKFDKDSIVNLPLAIQMIISAKNSLLEEEEQKQETLEQEEQKQETLDEEIIQALHDHLGYKHTGKDAVQELFKYSEFEALIGSNSGKWVEYDLMEQTVAIHQDPPNERDLTENWDDNFLKEQGNSDSHAKMDASHKVVSDAIASLTDKSRASNSPGPYIHTLFDIPDSKDLENSVTSMVNIYSMDGTEKNWQVIPVRLGQDKYGFFSVFKSADTPEIIALFPKEYDEKVTETFAESFAEQVGGNKSKNVVLRYKSSFNALNTSGDQIELQLKALASGFAGKTITNDAIKNIIESTLKKASNPIEG